jgi:hypothetical protein
MLTVNSHLFRMYAEWELESDIWGGRLHVLSSNQASYMAFVAVTNGISRLILAAILVRSQKLPRSWS